MTPMTTLADQALPTELQALTTKFSPQVIASAARVTLRAELVKFLTTHAKLSSSSDDDLAGLAADWRPADKARTRAAAKIEKSVVAMSPDERKALMEALKNLMLQHPPS